MNKTITLILFCITVISCEKDYLIPANEIPDWLKEQIKISEQKIKDDPSIMPAYGSWVRFNWKNEHYFEYSNPLSSSIGLPISFHGDTLKIFNPTVADYTKEKCCMRYVWKGPGFNEYLSPH